jgi:hypothetical protein
MLVQAIVVGVSRSSSSSFKLICTYQHQPIYTPVRLGVLRDVSIRHPWTHDAEWKQRLRNVDNGEYVGMGNGLAPTTEGLV